MKYILLCIALVLSACFQAPAQTIDFETESFTDFTDFGATQYTSGNIRISYQASSTTPNWYEDTNQGAGNSKGLLAFGFSSATETVVIETVDGSEIDFISFFYFPSFGTTQITAIEGFRDGSPVATLSGMPISVSGTVTLSNAFDAVDRVVITSGSLGMADIFDDFAFTPAAGDPNVQLSDLSNTDFGNVATGASSSIGYVVANTGTGTLTVAGITSSNTPAFEVVGSISSVAAGSSETFLVVFAPTTSGCTAQSATVTLSSNDPTTPTLSFAVSGTSPPVPEVSLSVLPAQANEDSDLITFTFTFSLSESTCTSLLVNFSVSGTATYNDDYYLINGADSFTATSGTLTIPAGQTSGEVVLQAQQDAIFEDDETIILNVSTP